MTQTATQTQTVMQTQTATQAQKAGQEQANHSYTARFLGTGTATSQTLGNSACVIEQQDKPWLMIDCGADALVRYLQYADGQLPSHVFITHLHFDHIGGIEQLYFQTLIRQPTVKPTLYVPAQLVHDLTQIMRNTDKGDHNNIWSVLRIVPVLENFWHNDAALSAIPVRHHLPNSTFGLHLPGVFFYSADTRPIPEIVHHTVGKTETILHDANLKANPSHAGADELLEQYSTDVLNRTVIYHYPSPEIGEKIKAKGLKVASPGVGVELGVG